MSINDRRLQAPETDDTVNSKESEALLKFVSKSENGYEQLQKVLLAKHSSLEAVRIYISMNPHCVRARDDSGNLPIHVAICRDDANVFIIAELLRAFPESAKARWPT